MNACSATRFSQLRRRLSWTRCFSISSSRFFLSMVQIVEISTIHVLDSFINKCTKKSNRGSCRKERRSKLHFALTRYATARVALGPYCRASAACHWSGARGRARTCRGTSTPRRQGFRLATSSACAPFSFIGYPRL